MASTTARSELPATTYRPQLLQVAVTPRPATLYTKQFITPSRSLVSSTAAPISRATSRPNIDFESEFQKFQQDNSIISSSPAPITKTIPRAKPATTTEASAQGQIYSSALVYDPSSGQYNTQLYQTLPQTEGQFSVNQRIQPYVYQPQQQTRPVYTIPQATYRQASAALPSQAVYQQQQAELQFQNSAQLYAQQQRARSQQQQQQLQQQPLQQQPQSYYYVQPTAQRTPALAGSQIDAFLRGHNIQF